jgi:hypothetical protein
MKLTIDIWEGKPTDQELQLEQERVTKMIVEGYKEGEIFSDGGGEQHKGYRGWWRLEK